MNFVEAFGTAASVIVAISLMMRNIKWLRVINALGAIAFAIYGAAIHALPVFALNAFIVAIDIWYLARMRATRDTFGVIKGDPANWSYLDQFLAFYGKDICRYSPDFSLDKTGGWKAEFIIRDMVPVSLIVWRALADGRIEIGLDYAVPSHRDFRSAEYYFRKAAEDIAKGKELVFVEWSAVPEHRRYLERIGFAAAGMDDEGRSEYRKTVKAY
ncbi:MAG TPA: hypothetical protein VMV44_16120 [Rectinemataceae bacterium]|nr:hypothetical protein [Rectinemataceae bacterium]